MPGELKLGVLNSSNRKCTKGILGKATTLSKKAVFISCKFTSDINVARAPEWVFTGNELDKHRKSNQDAKEEKSNCFKNC